jgi:hypothetical protein
MAIRFRCRSCRRLLSIGTRKAGHDVRCPICGRGQQAPQLPSPFEFPRSNWSPRGSGSQSRWTTYDGVFALALAAGGIAIILLLCLVVRISFPHSRQAADLPSAESAVTQKDKSSKQAEVPPGPNTEKSVDLAPDGAFVVQPAEMLFPPNNQKPIAIVPVVAQKLPPPPWIRIGKVRSAPEVVPEVQSKVLASAFSMKRRQNRSEEELRKELLLMAEITIPRLGPVKQSELGRPTLSVPGLQLRRGTDCQLGKEPAENLQFFSQKFRQFLQQTPSSGDCEGLRKLILTGDEMWRRPEAVPALVQMLQVENQPVRPVLLESFCWVGGDALSGINGRQATHALVTRALYDLSPAVREAAVKALQDRPAEEYRDALLAGLRYPWPAVADHAAEALATLNVQSAVPKLMDMLVKPGREKAQAKTALVQELVRINHQRNCMLCHPSSFSASDPVRGAVPTPGQSHSYSQGEIFVRADVTYLQQDFSVMHPAVKSGPGLAFQRYDYVVRKRQATAKEASPRQSWQKHRQREAILFALQELAARAGEPLQLPKALLRDESHQLRHKQAEVDYWKAQAERLAQEKEDINLNLESQKPTAPVPVSREQLRFNVDSIHWPIVFKEDRKLGSQFRALSQFLERLDANPGSQELVWAIKEALQVLNGLRAGLEAYPITSLHANEARNFLDGIETNLWALKRFI